MSDDYNFLFDPQLAALSANFDAVETERKSMSNILRQLQNDKPDKDGKMRGLGLGDDELVVVNIKALLTGIMVIEELLEKKLVKQYKTHPLFKWSKSKKGIGEKQIARLLGAIGDPYWNTLYDRPRIVSELWSYSGMGVNDGMAPRRQKGVQGGWNDDARMRIWNVSNKIVMQLRAPCGREEEDDEFAIHYDGCVCGEYRELYDAVREKRVNNTHDRNCARCGPAGKPALSGSPLSDGHKHARAIREVGKQILLDLWVESKRLHEERYPS
jgi:hypothetical protein